VARFMAYVVCGMDDYNNTLYIEITARRVEITCNRLP